MNVVFSQNSTCFDVARNGSVSEIKLLFKKDKSILNAIDANGSSMLILACYRGNHDVANFLIENGSDLNYVSPNGTVLMACVYKNELELVDKIVKQKANLNLTDASGLTPLMLAVQIINVEMVKKLVSAGANITLKCKQGKTAFEYAAFSGNEQIINLLK